ncbi:competence type IV pilus minor pilin ComGD [Sporolactobacillus sp. STCC-11]|uniref:competence type IV pilus minor pilin ComGD n=1 Tax=Sporolactobacillus caesalpiniae TaxID=3230362 RepID=UPI00339A975E
MHHKNNGAGGFTLLEVLITLSIACIIAPLSFLAVSHLADEITIRHFVEDLNETVRDAQMEAITQAQLARIVFNNPEHFYYVSINNRIERTEINKRILIYGGQENVISINQLGHFSRITTFTISLDKIRYKFVLLLGQGRCYFEKISG